jgi:hypothetical protein
LCAVEHRALVERIACVHYCVCAVSSVEHRALVERITVCVHGALV